jgi:hypothetical protein
MVVQVTGAALLSPKASSITSQFSRRLLHSFSLYCCCDRLLQIDITVDGVVLLALNSAHSIMGQVA